MGLFRFGKRKETDAQRAAWLDSAVHRAGQRVQHAMLADLRNAARSFEAAETPAWTESWSTTAAEINDDLSRQLPILRARSRNLARNNEWVARYLIQLDDNVLGPPGIQLQSRLVLSDGTPDKAANDSLEAAWQRWCQRGACEVSGKLNWRQVESAALKSLARDGELLIRFRSGGPMGFRVQLLNPALLDVMHTGSHQGRRIRMGVEITDDGVPVAYWLRAAKSGEGASQYVTTAKRIRIPADEILHAFDVHEHDQLRGYPWLTIGARRLWLLQDFEQSAAVASSNSAKREGFFVSPNGEAPPGFADRIVSAVLDAARSEGRTLSPEEIQRIAAAADKYSTTMPGQFDTLPQGYDFKPFDSVWPNLDAAAYVKQQVRGWAAARGMSYVTLGNDLEAVNYSSARVGIIDEREHYKGIQGLLIGWLHQEVFRRWLPFGVLATPSLQASRLDAYLAAARWQPRRWQGIDPAKEEMANDLRLKNKLTSRRRIIAERGEDPDEIAAEIAAEEDIYGQTANDSATASGGGNP